MNLSASMEKMGRWRLFTRNNANPSATEIIGWWELRRIAYNLIVGAAGIFTCGSILGIAAISSEIYGEPLGLPDPPFLVMLGIFAYGIAANICFTGGWMGELLAHKIWPEKMERFAGAAFFFGLMFSVTLTLLPAVFFGVILVLRLMFGS
jgi:hypothetical protein